MTYTFDELSAAKYVARRVAAVEAKGISLKLLNDFDHLREVVGETAGRAPLTPIFDNRVSEVGPDNAFWLLGSGADGTVRHLQAVRMDDLVHESLSEFLKRHGPQLMSPHIPGNPMASDYAACRYTREMRGRICYHGEVWLSPEGQVRGQGLSVDLPRIGVAIALLRWHPDFIYGLVHPDLVLKGIPARYGYTHFHPHGIRWHRTDQPGTLDEYITWMTRQDMQDMVGAE